VKKNLKIDYKIDYKNYNLKIAIANDKAFNFYYKDNIEYFEKNGIEIIEFSPINDDKLPKGISGIYLGGGFPEKFAKKLSENVSMLEDIKKFADVGGIIYGECGGLMYLSNGIYDFSKKRYRMASIFDFEVEMTKKLQRFGYVEVKYDDIFFRAHEFHRSKIINDKGLNKSYVVNKFTDKNKIYQDGFTYKNVLAGYPHVHFYSNLEFANKLIGKMEKFKGGIYE
jgi:cobyrinic acid a,c-diamide synthase